MVATSGYTARRGRALATPRPAFTCRSNSDTVAPFSKQVLTDSGGQPFRVVPIKGLNRPWGARLSAQRRHACHRVGRAAANNPPGGAGPAADYRDTGDQHACLA